MFTRKTPKHPELDPLGIGFDRILKFARAAKIFEKNIGGVQICTPPPAVRGLRLRLISLFAATAFPLVSASAELLVADRHHSVRAAV